MPNTLFISAASNTNFHNTANTTSYACGGCAQSTFNNTTEAQQQIPFSRAGTLANLSMKVGNSFAGATYVSRIGGASGTQSVVTNGTSALFQDLTHTDSVSVGNLVNFRCVAGSDIEAITGASMQFTGSGGAYGLPYCLWIGSTFNATANATRYLPLCGGANAITQDATEANPQLKFQAGTMSGLFIYVAVNSFTTSYTLTLRNNGISGNNQVVVASGATGLQQDATHSDEINILDKLCVQGTNTASGSLTFSHLGAWMDVPPGSPAMYGGEINVGSGLNYPATQFCAICGDEVIGGSTIEGRAQAGATSTQTWSNMRFAIATNTLSFTTTLVSRIGGVTGNQSVAVPSGGTGDFVDTTHNDSVTKSQLIGGMVTTLSGTGGGTYTAITNLFGDLTTPVHTPKPPKPRPKPKPAVAYNPYQQFYAYKVRTTYVRKITTNASPPIFDRKYLTYMGVR